MNLIKILNFDLYNLVLLFAIYSFLGWCTEVLYYFKTKHRFVNRGFLYGPFCPIYGFGLVCLIILLDNFKNNIFILFILSTFITSFIEYFTGLILEKIFKSKWWDYSDDPWNLHGRICLLYSLIWGAASVAVIKILHPAINNLVSNIPYSIGNLLFYTIILYFLVDFSFTISSLIKFKNFLYYIQVEFTNKFSEKPSVFLNTTKEKAAERAKVLESILSKFKITLNHIRLIQAFPNMSSKSFDYILKALKEKLKRINII